MLEVLIVFAIIFGMNIVPAFAPPTWTVLAYFALTLGISVPLLIVTGVVAAATGRWGLATLFRRYRHKLPKSYITNMENAETHVVNSQSRTRALLALFLVSPLSSAQLFEAAGMMKSIAIKPLVLAFAAGRLVTYSITVSSASAVAASSFGDVILATLTSPTAIVIQILMIAGLVLLGNIKWKPHSPVS